MGNRNGQINGYRHLCFFFQQPFLFQLIALHFPLGNHPSITLSSCGFGVTLGMVVWPEAGNQSFATFWPCHWFRDAQVNQAQTVRLSSGTLIETTGKRGFCSSQYCWGDKMSAWSYWKSFCHQDKRGCLKEREREKHHDMMTLTLTSGWSQAWSKIALGLFRYMSQQIPFGTCAYLSWIFFTWNRKNP